MKNTVILFLVLISFSIQAQEEESAIRSTVQVYIKGSSYNLPDTIKKAFYPGAELFLSKKDNSLFVVPVSEYAGWFGKRESGQFNGRIGRILSMDREGEVATAKVEILMPNNNLRFIDYFLLKKIEGEWKIISKTAHGVESNKKGEKVLFVVSNAHFYGKSQLPTGNSFSEIVRACHVLKEAGIQVDFVSPQGGAVPLAYINTSESLEKQFLYDTDFMYALKNTLSPNQLKSEDYKAVYFVGGGSAMFEVPVDVAIQNIAMEIYEQNNGVIASVCHGTAGIVYLKKRNGDWLVKGKKVVGYPESFERQDAAYFQEFPFKIQETIEKEGGIFVHGERNKAFVAVDGRLVTGQNHLSSAQVAEKIISIINVSH